MSQRGTGAVYHPTYKDKKTGKLKEVATWWIRYFVRGKPHIESANTPDRGVALKLLKRRVAEAQSGRPFGRDVEKTTLGDMVKMVLDDYAADGQVLKGIRSPLAHLLAYFGADCLAIDITSDRITAFKTERQAAGAKNATINRSLSGLHRGFRLAITAGKVAHVPIINKLTEDNRRKGFFEEDQLAAVLEKLPEHYRPIVEVAYITGWRLKSELGTRQKHHVDLNAGWLRLDPGESKNGEGRNFPLTPRLRAILEHQLEQTRALEVATGTIVPWLFHRGGRQIKTFYIAWDRACEEAGVPSKLLHDFRRSAIRNLERAGISRSAAMAMVGHKTQSIYSRYAIADERTLKEAAEKLAALDTLTPPASAKVVDLWRKSARKSEGEV
jgi:integrase